MILIFEKIYKSIFKTFNDTKYVHNFALDYVVLRFYFSKFIIDPENRINTFFIIFIYFFEGGGGL